ncbi:biliverdin-producing heme oxygenase [Wenjunlia tyrosinilytica]|uniref:Heme oxygenase n=1 Tax=Wenjunlia tyrosinilytica TaxID=1544741 RepID=A0A917ZB56_9ACTN|nr:biliverdin-producing heme oxygenase [Wenjunlia tyrosinilytica]GGO80075.1 heme oxygenase [Wenjunlia tyrosinilytica]
MEPTPFSTAIRTASQGSHAATNHSPFMSHLLDGRLGLDAFTRMTEQLWFVYEALEGSAQRLEDDPVAGPFLKPELMRAAELAKDLAHLSGPGWRRRLEPLPVTAVYAARIREVAEEWPAGYVAHHYTRYLGDLSGGQIIRSIAERRWGLDHRGDGVRFYVFTSIPNPAEFKREYRALLDGLPVDEVEKQRVIEECRRAFGFNRGILEALDGQFPLSA